MKTCVFSFLFLALCADSWAQLTCTNCTVTAADGTAVGSATPAGTPFTIPVQDNTFAGNIRLDGACEIKITGTGNYTLSGQITGIGPLTYNALAAGEQGKLAGITLSGSTPNSYTGQTILSRGYLICNKTNAVAIPNNLTISAVAEGLPVHLWCKANNQLGNASIVDFRGALSNSFFHLNGTTQTIAGMRGNNSKAVVENWEQHYRPSTMANEQPDKGAILNIAGGSFTCIYGGGGTIRKGTTEHPLTVNVISGIQMIQNPSDNITNVTLTSAAGAILVFSTGTPNDYILGSGVTFGGAGIIKKTGLGTIATNGATYLKTTGQIWVNEGVWKNQNANNRYTSGVKSNKATLQVDVPRNNRTSTPTFDLGSDNSIFGGLTGGGRVYNNWGRGNGYSDFTLNPNDQSVATFAGVIQDNSTNGPVNGNGDGKGGIRLKKGGSGTQVLTGNNRYTGSTTVSSGTLKLEEGGQLGGGTYGGVLEIAHVSSSVSQATFEHNGNQPQVFNGNITSTGEGGTKGIFLQSGIGKSIINGTTPKSFTGQVNVTGGFLGGSGNLKNAAGVTVGANGSIGGGDGVVGNILTVSGLSLAAGSKLVVTSMSGTTPSLLDVKQRATDNQGTITVAGVFTVDVLEANLVSGRIIKCTNNVANNPPLPVIGQNNTGGTVSFSWAADGLYMVITKAERGLACNNCSFDSATGTVRGTQESPALILTSSDTPFTGHITLNGDCSFTVIGAGNYTLSGQISGNYSLTLHAPGTANTGLTAGLTFAGGGNANSYGSTTINSGYIICNKNTGVLAIPGNVKISGGSIQSHLWFLANNNQLPENAVVAFTGTAGFHLNGTTQAIAGLTSNTDGAVVENNGGNTSFPAGMTAAQVSANAATLDIKAGTASYTFGGGGHIRKGGTGALTVNVVSGTQIIQNPSTTISNVTLASAAGATLEFNVADNTNANILGQGITFGGAGIIKKTGPGAIATNGATYLKTAGKIWVSEGVWKNHNTNNIYTSGADSNQARLQVDAPNAIFDLMSDASTFGGLTGDGWVRNNWGRGDGYTDLTLNQNDTETSATFDGIIQNNPTNGPVNNGGDGKGGIRLKKGGNGTQVLKGNNRYTGSTTVSAGTLRLEEGGQLGGGTYGSALEIANVSVAASQATFEYNGNHPQVFTGPITNTGGGDTKGIFLQSGRGKSIINGDKSFSGQVNITGGFLGGSGSLKNAAGVTVGASGSIGGGEGENANAGATLTVTGLSLTAGSKLVVTSRSATDNTPSLVDVKEMGTNNQGTVTVAAAFMVDVLGVNLVSGRILGCTVANNPPVPVLGRNWTERTVTFRWEPDGLYMDIVAATIGLSCNNCTFGSGEQSKTGTPAIPAFILTSPGSFAGDITLNGPCNFTIIGAGNYTLSCQIRGNHPLTLDAPGTANTGLTAGLTFAGGDNANSYGSTTINSGYIICNKNPRVLAIPGNVKLAGSSVQSHLWCLANSQLSETAVVDFTGTAGFHLNGTAQAIAGLTANTNSAVVENNGGNTSIPAGMTAVQVSTNAATLDIKAASGSYTFLGEGHIRKGGTGALTVNVMSGTQIIQNPSATITNVTLTSEAGATLEFNTTNSNTYILGQGITFGGAGIIKKTGPGVVATNGATYLKTAGKIWVSEGVWRNHNTNNSYGSGAESNKATLLVDIPSTTFDLMGDASTFGGLTGSGGVRNNWGRGDGYTDFTINQNDTQNTATFVGIIQNNQTNGPVNNGGDGKGGIHLKKGGNGIQVLTGNNRYTGSTTVSAGTLKLGEGGQLGGGTYGGALEIAHVSSSASQATFEHAGTQAQIFTGNITSTGGGGIKGIFLQSGSGKSIINGAEAKSFTGQVNITGGFLGGSGNLRNATGVTVGEHGSIGGGARTAATSATLTVSNLTFAAATSKLIVTTSTPGNTPPLSLVEVKASTGAGTIAATASFTVEVVGNNLASGYILKCSNGVGLPIPRLELPANSTMAGKVSLRWDGDGLWMQIGSYGTIALSTASSVCPKGDNLDNPSITVTATYSDRHDTPPPEESPADYFTISPNNAKSGLIKVTRLNTVVTAVFDGANATTADLSYTITYDDHRNLPVTSGVQKINRQPTLSLSSEAACLGKPFVLQAVGNGAVTITSSDLNKATVGDISATKSATVTTRAPGHVSFLATDGDGCKSDYLTIEVDELPVITPENPAVCVRGLLTLTAVGHEPSTTSAWALSSGTSTGAASLEALTPPEGKKVNFRAGSTVQNVTVEYTDHQGCKATTSVAIRTVLTLTPASTSPICSETETDILLTPSLSNATYTWTVGTNSVGAQSQTTPSTSNSIAQTLTNSGNAPVTVTYRVTGTSGTCISAPVNIAVEVSHLQAATGTATGGGQYCVGLENNTYRTNLIPSVVGRATSVEWIYTSSFPQNQAPGLIRGKTQKLTKGALTAVNDNLVLSAHAKAPAEVYYVFRPFISCLGTPSDTVRVKLHSVPVAGAVANSAICSSLYPAHPTKTNIALSSTPTGTVYTWTVDKSNSADVTGYSQPSRNGATVPTRNPPGARPSPIEEALSLPATALKAQTIRYNITPWHSGCPGKIVSTNVTVHPRPVLTVSPPTASICIGGKTDIRLSTNLSAPESNGVTYSWAVSDNTIGAQSSSANQSTFEQEELSLSADAANGSVTYTFTPLYAPGHVTFSCEGQSATSTYTVARPVEAGTITDRTPVKACLGDPSIILTATPEGTRFLWLQNGIIIPGVTGSTYVVPTNAVLDAKYAVRIVNACGDKDSGDKEVKVTQDAYFTTDAKAEGPTEGEINKPVNFTYTPNLERIEYSWDFKDNTPVATIQNPSHTYLKAGTYRPTLKVTKSRQSECFRDFELSLTIKEGIPPDCLNSSGAFSVFPIPTQDRLTIINDCGDLQNITIHDVNGKTVMSEAVKSSKAILSIAHFANGIYLLTVTDSKGVKYVKISKN